MDALIVGAGAMGRWFASAADVEPAFADRNEDAAAAAADAVGGRHVPLSGDECFEIVCIAVPIPAAADAIAAHAGRAERAIVDVTGAMAEPVAAMAKHAPEIERLSLHPLFAPENEPGAVAAVVDARGPVTESILDALDARGNSPFETTPDEHDRAMETVQAKVHTAVLAYALAADDVPEPYDTQISEGMAELADEVTGGTPRVYADIQAAFDGADAVADAAERIADADRAAFEQLYREAGER